MASEITGQLKNIRNILKLNSVNTDKLVFNESASVGEFDGINKIFTFNYQFQLRSTQVYNGTTRMPLDIAYEESIDGLTITFLGDAPDPLTSTLFWDYIKA